MLARTLLRAAPRFAPRVSMPKSSFSRPLSFKSTPRMRSPVPNEEHSAHTVTQRIRSWWKSLPVETYPLFVVMGCSLGFGVYSFILPAINDPTLRLRRSNASNHHQANHH